MPAQRMKVDISKLALNLDGCRFGSPPAIDKPEQQQQRHDHDSKQSRRRRQLLTNSSNYSDHDDNIDDNDGDDNDKLSPLSTYHLNHRAQYNPHQNKNNHHHHSSQYHNDLTSPLGTTYRREGLSIGHNFLRFQGSTLSDNFNSNQLDVLECIGRGVCSSVWKARRKQTSDGVIRLEKQAEKICSSKQPLEQQQQEEEEYYALKIFSMRDPQKRTMLIRELKLLCSTNTTSVNNNNNSNNADDNNTSSFSQQQQQGQECECLVELEGAFLDEMDGTVTLVLEYMNFGSLADLLSTPPPSTSTTTTPLSFDSSGSASKNNKMPEYAIASIAYQMIWGLGYLHHEGVLHRDIKPANVLLSKEGRVKLADFGIVSNNNNSSNYSNNSYNDHNNNNDDGGGGAIDYDAMNITMIGTTRYMSPERLHGQPYNQQADIWSLGLILLECTRGGGNSPFEHISSIVELVQTLDDCMGGTMEEYIPHDTSMGLTEILLGCLNHCPEKRIPADVLIGSPWFELHGIECVGDAVVGMKRYLETL